MAARKFDDAFWLDLSKNDVGLWKPLTGSREAELVEMLMDDGVPQRHAEIVVCLAADHGANEARKSMVQGVATGAKMLARKIFGRS